MSRWGFNYCGEASWPAGSRVDTESWGRYLTQHYANAPQAPIAESCAREMTAADLWGNDPYELRRILFDLLFGESPDAPYSFWLGADK